MKRIALFSICFVFFIFSVKPALSHSSAERTGVFFCTRDLHPEIYDQIGKKVTSSSIFTVASSSIYYSSPIPYRIARVGVGVGGGAAIAMFSYEAIYNLYKKGFPSVKESITSSTNSIGSMSGVKGNFVHVQDKNLNNKDVSTYRHCSILVAQYIVF